MKRLYSSTMGWMLGLAAVLLSSPEVHACATCFGQTDSPLGRGLNWGIFSLLVVVSSVVGAICSFFIYLARRAAKLESEPESSSPSTSALSSSQSA